MVMAETELLQKVSLERIAEAMRVAGYRAQLAEDSGQRQVIQSAAQGVGFLVLPGNAVPGTREFVDFSFTCLIRVEGGPQAIAIEEWNRGKRFAKLHRDGEMLVLSLDALVAGGIAGNVLLAYCELWDRVLRDFIGYLKTAQMAAAPAGPEAASGG